MNRVDMAATGKNIAAICKKNGFTRAQAADMIGVTPVAMTKWCKGINMPTIDNIVIMAGIFGVRIDDIVCICDGA